ncbi:MAG TPA: hypothetical protein VGO09_00005, partial [Flavisolibacter sp.]|nr:hypothetical protein [Flavisolibacter sp.]
LITNSSIAILANVIMQLNQKNLNPSIKNVLSAGSATAISQLAIEPYLQKPSVQTFALQSSSFVGPIQAMLQWQAFVIINTIIEQQGGISTIIKKTDFKKLLIRPVQESPNEITTFLLPRIQTFVKNESISFVLSDIGWKVFTAALVGVGMYIAGIDRTEGATFLEALYYASLDGIQKGLIASLISTATKKTGALISVSSALALPATTIINSVVQKTDIVMEPQKIVPEFLKITAQVATDFIVDESKGFKNLFKTTASEVKESIKTCMPGLYDFFYVMTQGYPEINPSAEDEPTVAY